MKIRNNKVSGCFEFRLESYPLPDMHALYVNNIRCGAVSHEFLTILSPTDCMDMIEELAQMFQDHSGVPGLYDFVKSELIRLSGVIVP